MGVTDWFGGMVDFLRNPRRYRSEGEEVDLDETADPSTWRDETKPTWSERLASRKRQFIAFSFVGLVTLGLIGAYSRTYLPALYGNELLKEALKWAIAVPVLFFSGAKWQRGKLQRIDRLDLQIEDQVTSYWGTYAVDSQGNALFTPVKGFDWFGLRARKLTLGDLADDFARSFAKQGRSASDPAKIRVEDGLYGTAETATGRVISVVTSGLEVDGFGRESDLYTQPPDLADREKYRRLSRSMEKVHERNSELQDRIETLEEDRDKWKDEAKKDRKEIIDELTDTHGELAEAGFQPRQQHGGRQTPPADYGNGGDGS